MYSDNYLTNTNYIGYVSVCPYPKTLIPSKSNNTEMKDKKEGKKGSNMGKKIRGHADTLIATTWLQKRVHQTKTNKGKKKYI